MCGRFVRVSDEQQLAVIFELNEFPRQLKPQFNLAPTQMAAVVQGISGSRRMTQMRWGLIPAWAKDEKVGYRTINARAETLAEKPAFRAAFEQRRCLVVADGFYEWQRKGREKLPHYFHMVDKQPFAFAGLWERWRGPNGSPLDQPLESFTIITTEPNELLEKFHDRMPVILDADSYDLWLDNEFRDMKALSSLLRPGAADDMSCYQVSTIVNNVRNDRPECTQPYRQRELF